MMLDVREAPDAYGGSLGVAVCLDANEYHGGPRYAFVGARTMVRGDVLTQAGVNVTVTDATYARADGTWVDLIIFTTDLGDGWAVEVKDQGMTTERIELRVPARYLRDRQP